MRLTVSCAWPSCASPQIPELAVFRDGKCVTFPIVLPISLFGGSLNAIWIKWELNYRGVLEAGCCSVLAPVQTAILISSFREGVLEQSTFQRSIALTARAESRDCIE